MTPQPANPDETPAADFARPVLERQLAELERLADIGMEIAEGLRRVVAQAAEPDAEPVDPVAITLAFSRVSRAVRLTCALQVEVIDKLRGVGRIEDYEAGLATPVTPTVAKEDPRLRARKDDIAATVTGIIDEIHKDAEGGEAHERCIREATERLKDAEDLGDILSRPFEEVVEQICRDLGLSRLPSPLRGEGAGMGVTPGAQAGPPPVNLHGATKSGAVSGRWPAYSPPSEPRPPPIPTLSPLKGERAERPYTPPPNPDALPGYPVGLPGELPPRGRRPQPPPRNYTHGWD